MKTKMLIEKLLKAILDPIDELLKIFVILMEVIFSKRLVNIAKKARDFGVEFEYKGKNLRVRSRR